MNQASHQKWNTMEVEEQFHAFLTLASGKGKWSLSYPDYPVNAHKAACAPGLNKIW
jgi:hypothetical protein